MNIEDYVDDFVDAESRIIIIEEAMELLNDGYPLDEEITLKLESIDVEPEEFTRRHAEKTSGRLRAS